MTDTPEMIERVARALCWAQKLDPDALCYNDRAGEGGRQMRWTWWVKEARAAIEAMREPTGYMAEIGTLGPGCDRVEAGVKIVASRHVESWHRMIDAALGRYRPHPL